MRFLFPDKWIGNCLSSTDTNVSFGYFLTSVLFLKKPTLNLRVKKKIVNLILIDVFGYLYFLFYERCFNIFKELSLIYIFIRYLMTERKYE